MAETVSRRAELRVGAEELAYLESIGMGVTEPTDFVPVNSLDEFYRIAMPNFRMHFWRWPMDAPYKPCRGQLICADAKHLDRFISLFPDYFAELEEIVGAYEEVNLAVFDRKTGVFTREDDIEFLKRVLVPKLLPAWNAMSQLVDRKDQDFIAYADREGEEHAAHHCISRN